MRDGNEHGDVRGALPESEERPPPGIRTAAIVRWGLVGLMALAAAAAWTYHVTTSGLISTAQVRFHCPMHPTIVASHRGECPICGMDLVPVAPDAKAGPAPTAPAAASASAPAAGALYTCPMHPEFVTGDATARCPRCGMRLVARSADAAAQEAVPGLGAVELAADRVQLMGLRTAVARRQVLPSTIRTSAFVAPTDGGVVSITARYTGWVESVAVDETGRAVERGDVLATVYSPDLTAALQSLTAAARWSGRAPGASAGAAQGDPVRDARQRVELLGIARQDLDAIVASGEIPRTLPIRSPVRGHVARKSAVTGGYVTPGTELFQIADLSRVWAVADVHENDVGRVRIGRRATLELPAWPGERFTGRISFVSPALAVGSRTLQARIELRNPDLKLRPGMYGDVTIELPERSAVTVPADALVDTGELQYVFVSRGDGRFEPRRVEAGWRGDGQVALLSGVTDGERVVTTATFLLDSESRLRAAVAASGVPPGDDAAEPGGARPGEGGDRPPAPRSGGHR